MGVYLRVFPARYIHLVAMHGELPGNVVGVISHPVDHGREVVGDEKDGHKQSINCDVSQLKLILSSFCPIYKIEEVRASVRSPNYNMSSNSNNNYLNKYYVQ